MKKVLLLVVAIMLLQILPLGAQICDGGGYRSDVVVTVAGQDEAFTIYRDYKKADQFYFVPNSVRLATRGTGKQKVPVFHLLKYQTKDQDSNELVEGGILQFSVKITPEGEVIKAMRDEVAKQFKIDVEKVKLTPLPFKKAEVTIYDLKGVLLATSFQKPGIAPSFANSEIPFQVQLTNLSADVYDALAQGGGGIPVYITFTYDLISVPNGFKVSVNWDQTFTHFSEDEKTKEAFTQWYYYRTWWGGRRARAQSGVNETHKQTIHEVLLEKKDIQIESVVGEDMTQAEINNYLDPIVERINKELVEKMSPPEKIDAAVTTDPGNPLWWRKSSNMALKDIKKEKKGKEVFEFSRQHFYESKTTFGSIVGIGEYPDQIKQKLITIKPAGNWDYAYFTVPAVGDGAELAIGKISLQVIPKYYKDVNGRRELVQIKNTAAELVTWTPENGYFTDRKGNEITNILFPMQAITDQLEKENIPRENCCYEVNLSVTQNRDILKFTSICDFLMGGVPVSTPLAMLEGVVVDCDYLDFSDSREKGGLAAVNIKVNPEKPKKTYNRTIKSKDENKTAVFLVQKEEFGEANPVKASIYFVLIGSKKVAWKHNGRNLRNDDLGLDVILWDTDYQAVED